MTRPYSLAYKQKAIERLTGKNAVSAHQLSREVGVPQGTLSQWLQDARNLPLMAIDRPKTKVWSIDEKVRVLAEASKLGGTELARFLDRESMSLAQLEQWRMALADEGRGSTATSKRIHKLERELARKEKALAEAATLLVLKKKVQHLWEDEEGDTDEENEK